MLKSDEMYNEHTVIQKLISIDEIEDFANTATNKSVTAYPIYCSNQPAKCSFE